MNPLVLGCIIIALLFFFMFLRMPVGFAMILLGFVGTIFLVGWDGALTVLVTTPFTTLSNYTLSVIPLFVLMGVLASYIGMSNGLYNAACKWIGHWPGGLAMATNAACTIFAAIVGTGMATIATIGTVALPEMRRYGYSDSLSTAVICAGATLGILIPPSIPMVIYAMMVQVSLGKLLIAGFIPGILIAGLFMLVINIQVRRNPTVAPRIPSSTWRERFSSLKGVVGAILVIGLIIGGIYGGIFTPNEAAAIGVALIILMGIINRRLTRKNFFASLIEAARMSAMMLIILCGAYVFNFFLGISGVPNALANLINELHVSRYLILVCVILLYIVLGCLMDTMSMIVLTMPTIYPIMTNLGFDGIWFGIITMLMMEQAGLTPPMGIMVFCMGGVAKDIPMSTIFKGVWPFVLAVVLGVVILTVFPQIVTFVPDTMRNPIP